MQVPEGGADGALVAHGGATGGYALYIKDGKPSYHYNIGGLLRWITTSTEKLPPGAAHAVRAR